MKVLIFILTIFISVMLIGCKYQNDLSNKEVTKNSNKNNQIIPSSASGASKLNLISSEWAYEEYFTYITGIVENTSDKKATLVCIKFALFDKDNVKLGKADSCIDSLAAGEKWKFKVMVTKKDVDYYKFEEITGF